MKVRKSSPRLSSLQQGVLSLGRSLNSIADAVDRLERSASLSVSSSSEVISSPADGDGYFSGNQVKTPGTGWTFYGSGTSGPNTWFDLDDGYSNTVEQEFSEDGTTGDLIYSGSDPKKFGVFYSNK